MLHRSIGSDKFGAAQGFHTHFQVGTIQAWPSVTAPTDVSVRARATAAALSTTSCFVSNTYAYAPPCNSRAESPVKPPVSSYAQIHLHLKVSRDTEIGKQLQRRSSFSQFSPSATTFQALQYSTNRLPEISLQQTHSVTLGVPKNTVSYRETTISSYWNAPPQYNIPFQFGSQSVRKYLWNDVQSLQPKTVDSHRAQNDAPINGGQKSWPLRCRSLPRVPRAAEITRQNAFPVRPTETGSRIFLKPSTLFSGSRYYTH